MKHEFDLKIRYQDERPAKKSAFDIAFHKGKSIFETVFTEIKTFSVIVSGMNVFKRITPLRSSVLITHIANIKVKINTGVIKTTTAFCHVVKLSFGNLVKIFSQAEVPVFLQQTLRTTIKLRFKIHSLITFTTGLVMRMKLKIRKNCDVMLDHVVMVHSQERLPVTGSITPIQQLKDLNISELIRLGYWDKYKIGQLSTMTIEYMDAKDSSMISTFKDIKNALNAGINLSGLVGEQVTATRQNRSLVFDVVDYDAADESVWLLLHDTMPIQMAFEPSQALAWFGEGLSAGAYFYTNGGTNYYFTLTKPIPAGGQFMATTSTFSTYANQDASTALESGSVSETVIAGATSLGTTGTGDLNHMDRVLYGSNNAGESGLFAWLNSDAEPNTNLPRVNKFSRPYSSGTDGGFLRGFDATDLGCIENTEWTIQANNVYEAPASMGGIATAGQPYTLTGKIGFAKFENVGLSGNNPWDLYVGATNADRIKDYNGGAREWWVFGVYPSSAYHEYSVNSSGGSVAHFAYGSCGVVPVCKIKKSK